MTRNCGYPAVLRNSWYPPGKVHRVRLPDGSPRVGDVTLGEISKWPSRSADARIEFRGPFPSGFGKTIEAAWGQSSCRQCSQRGTHFAGDNFALIEALAAKPGDAIEHILEWTGIPRQLITPEMTINEIGALATYARVLKMVSRKLRTSVNLSITDVLPERLPSYALLLQLEVVQRKADRVAGSDLGDQHIAALLPYADFVEVDKRTNEYLRRVGRQNPELAEVMGRFGRTPHYDMVPALVS